MAPRDDILSLIVSARDTGAVGVIDEATSVIVVKVVKVVMLLKRPNRCNSWLYSTLCCIDHIILEVTHTSVTTITAASAATAGAVFTSHNCSITRSNAMYFSY